MQFDLWFYLVGLTTAFLVSVSKGAFGGGLAILSVPLLSLVMSPIEAAIVTAPLVLVMDVVAIGQFGPSTWSKPDLRWMVPGLMAGIAIGYFFFTAVDPNFVNLGIGVITLAFALDYFLRRRMAPATHPPSPWLASIAGIASGFTTFVAHAGGPPANMYLLRRGLHKTVYVGTLLAIFFFGNIVKIVPYGILALARPDTLWAAALLTPAVPLGVWLGKKLHDRLDQQQLIFWAYVLLTVAAARLLYSAIRVQFG